MDTQVNSPRTRVSALQELPGALGTLREALGIEESFGRGEKLLHLDIESTFSLVRLDNLNETRVGALRQLLGEALFLTVLHDEEVILADQSLGISDSQYSSLLKTLAPDTKLTLRLSLDKSKLLDHHGLHADSQTQRLFLYLFSDRLPYLFSRELAQCEDDLWGDDSWAQVVILVCDDNLCLTGDYLTICGGEHLTHWTQFLRGSATEPISEVGVCASKMNALCRDNLRWDKKWVHHLTPMHFKCEARAGRESSELTRVLALQQARLTMLYSADNTREIQDRVWSTYQGGQSLARIGWPTVKDEAQQQRSHGSYEDAARRMTSLIEWIYEPTWPVDRLLMTQLYLGDEMRACEPHKSFDFLLTNIDRIENDLKSRWKDFISKKLDGYSEQERSFEDDVAKTTQGYADQLAGLIKGLVDNGLAAAVAVIGSFLASFYSVPFNGFTFAWGLRIYGGYVLIFPLLLGLTYSWGQFRALRQEFAGRKARIEERLDTRRVALIVQKSQIQANERRFKRWIGTALVIYCLLIVCTFLGAHYLPPLIQAVK